MSDDKEGLHARARKAVEALAESYRDQMDGQAGFSPEAWFDSLRQQIVGRAETLHQVDNLGAMGGGGPDEA
jgi:hypothetical protein